MELETTWMKNIMNSLYFVVFHHLLTCICSEEHLSYWQLISSTKHNRLNREGMNMNICETSGLSVYNANIWVIWWGMSVLVTLEMCKPDSHMWRHYWRELTAVVLVVMFRKNIEWMLVKCEWSCVSVISVWTLLALMLFYGNKRVRCTESVYVVWDSFQLSLWLDENELRNWRMSQRINMFITYENHRVTNEHYSPESTGISWEVWDGTCDAV